MAPGSARDSARGGRRDPALAEHAITAPRCIPAGCRHRPRWELREAPRSSSALSPASSQHRSLFPTQGDGQQLNPLNLSLLEGFHCLNSSILFDYRDQGLVLISVSVPAAVQWGVRVYKVGCAIITAPLRLYLGTVLFNTKHRPFWPGTAPKTGRSQNPGTPPRRPKSA